MFETHHPGAQHIPGNDIVEIIYSISQCLPVESNADW